MNISDISIVEKSEHSPVSHELPEDILGRKVYYISDLHLNMKRSKGFDHLSDEEYIQHAVCKMDGGEPFGDSPLIILGDIADDAHMVDVFFSILRKRREGPIIYILGNHESSTTEGDFQEIIKTYKNICDEHDVVLLQNEMVFYYDERTANGELLEYWSKTLLCTDDILTLEDARLRDLAKKSKLTIFGSIGLGDNADGATDIVKDTFELHKCERCYFKILTALKEKQVIIATHFPLKDWTNIGYSSNFIYMNGHTHFDHFELTRERTIFSDNQIGYESDDYSLKYFKISGQYDPFINFEDGIHKISYEEYIDFQIGNNMRVKKKEDDNQIYMLKKSGIYMFVYYNKNNGLVLLNGGGKQRLSMPIDFYYAQMETYAIGLKNLLKDYINTLTKVSYYVKSIGGSGKIHGCIVDIDINNHLYVNPNDGKITAYFAEDTRKEIVYDDIKSLLSDRCPALFRKLMEKENNKTGGFNLFKDISNPSIEISNTNIYNASRVIKRIQYLIFQNVIREWNEEVFSSVANNGIFNALSHVIIDDRSVV